MDLRLPMDAHLPFVYWRHFAKKKKSNSKLKCFLAAFNCQTPMFGFLCVAKYVGF
jgi:hypothetical protein